MSDVFPPEIVDLILCNLSDSPEILECSLVCRSWLPCARRHLFLPSKYLKLEQRSMVELQNLAESPHSSLSLIRINKLHLFRNHIVENIDIENGHRHIVETLDPDGWRDDTIISDFLDRGPVFTRVSSLFLECLNWKTMSPAALASLRTNYVYIRELELRRVAISLNEEFRYLLGALTALEKIIIGENVPFNILDSSSVDDQLPFSTTELPDSGPNLEKLKLSHPTLCTFIFPYHVSPSTLQYFARALGHTASSINISLRFFSGDPKWEEISSAFGELLIAAGNTLQVLKLGFRFIRPQVGDVSDPKFFVFPRNPNLRELELEIVNEFVLNSFIRGLGRSFKPALSQLQLILFDQSVELKGLEKWVHTWKLVDETLSSMVSPLVDQKRKLIVDIRILVPDYRLIENHTGFTDSEESLARKKVEDLLPRVAVAGGCCWTLEVRLEINFQVAPTRRTMYYRRRL